MDDFPFQTIGLSEDEIELFSEVYSTLKSKFEATFTDYADTGLDIDKFDACKGFEKLDLRELINIGEDCYIALVETSYSYTGSKGSKHVANGFQAWGVSKMKNNFGHVFIKPERISEKLLELINPIELDFEEDPKFSKKFYVLAKDKHTAAKSMGSAFRTVLLTATIKDFYLEICGDNLLIAIDRLIIPKEVLDMAMLIKSLSTIR